jgi:hypothetical protein
VDPELGTHLAEGRTGSLSNALALPIPRRGDGLRAVSSGRCLAISMQLQEIQREPIIFLGFSRSCPCGGACHPP